MPSSSARPSSENMHCSDLDEAIRTRAKEIYLKSGGSAGRDLENWIQPEAEILRERSEASGRRAVIVDVDGVQYVGEYSSESSEGYSPGEFATGEDLAVRFNGEKMFVRRPNGKELETTVVHKLG
jgi:Protein of unknown function (DUF2934)